MRFLVLILFILKKVNASDIGNCTVDGRVECCSNYFLKEEKCFECPVGTYGTNCTSSCPSNRFGSQCLQICNCSKDQICDDKYGCRTPEYYKELYGNIEFLLNTTTKCCTNQRIQGNNCQDCWNGTFGSDCQYKCPPNRYGRFCLNRCNCTANETCHYATGCKITTGNMKCPPGTFGKNCTRCPPNGFGDECRGTCDCSKDQICDSKNGCMPRPPEYFKKRYGKMEKLYLPISSSSIVL
ncbi:multiple epidermal growth factor-like domains protein 10 isoform X2 [Saccostrea cucullata]|uniref:multiple epidermal growth factor-like domains protein 10 isoform X2 n=1 Tax=Saccostrea cuccullata TaxID=36930 RepID=UPI002ED6B7A4